MNRYELTRYIKTEALRLGFDVCGIAPASPVSSQVADEVNRWVADGNYGTMAYMERNSEKRLNPCLLVEGCKSIISVALNYYPGDNSCEECMHLSRYARGADYHKVVKDKLYLLLQSINSVAECKGRPFCDSAPVLERYWAVQAGLGWVGRNRQLIIPKAGSHFFLGELLVDIELDYDTPFDKSYCGNCRKCIDACPGGALSPTGIDARKCLSYLTIEHRGELPENLGEKMKNCFYGCDACLKACPHNRFAIPTREEAFHSPEKLSQMSDDDWLSLSEEEYSNLFSHSAVERCGYSQLKRNIEVLRRKN